MLQRQRRIAAYGVIQDRAGAVLLTRASSGSARPGTWCLPGGGIEHGEHPADAVVREVAEQPGLAVAVVRLRDVTAEVLVQPSWVEHTDAVVYDLAVGEGGGMLRPEPDGSTEAARWVLPAELAGLPLSGVAAYTLSLLPPPAPVAAPPPPVAPAGPAGPRPRTVRGQRFGVYGLVTDPADRVLLTLITDGYPGAGRWHLPGGGTDFGEQPVAGLLRELAEESGQAGEVSELLTVSHRHTPAAYGPEGHAIDWHAVRAVFRVTVPRPTPPQVLDKGGSTADAAWFTRAQVRTLKLTEIAANQLGLRD